MCVGKAGNANSLSSALARRLKMCWWVALLSFPVRWGYMKHEKKQNLFKHITVWFVIPTFVSTQNSFPTDLFLQAIVKFGHIY